MLVVVHIFCCHYQKQQRFVNRIRYILQNYCKNKPLKFSIFRTGKNRPNAGHYGLHWDTAWGALDQATDLSDLVLIILDRV